MKSLDIRCFFDSIFHRVVLPLITVLALSHDRSVFARMPNFSPLWKQSGHSFGLPTLDVDASATMLSASRLRVSESPHLVGGNVTRDRSEALPLSAEMRLSVFLEGEKRDEIFCFGAGSYSDVRFEGLYRFHLVALTWKKNFSDYSLGFVELTFGGNGNIKNKSHYHELTSSVK